MKELLLNKAQENLRAAGILFDNNLFNASSNRAYYAAFHAALAIIMAKGLQVKTDHAKVQATFNGEVLRRAKFINVEYRRYLSEMQNIRNYADYNLESISKRTAKLQLTMAEQFLTVIFQELTNESY